MLMFFLIALMDFNLGIVPWLGNILYAVIQTRP